MDFQHRPRRTVLSPIQRLKHHKSLKNMVCELTLDTGNWKRAKKRANNNIYKDIGLSIFWSDFDYETERNWKSYCGVNQKSGIDHHCTKFFQIIYLEIYFETDSIDILLTDSSFGACMTITVDPRIASIHPILPILQSLNGIIPTETYRVNWVVHLKI